MSSHTIQFHDLVGLLEAKCDEITAAAEGGKLSDKDTEVINYLRAVNAQLIIYCEDDLTCPSYVYCPLPDHQA